MALIEFKCVECGKLFEELVQGDTDRQGIVCPDCGGGAEQNYSGKCYGAFGKASGGCSGNCKTCSGCKH